MILSRKNGVRAGEANGIGGIAPPILVDLNRLGVGSLTELGLREARCFAIGDKVIPNG